MPYNPNLANSVLFQLFRTPEWRSISRMVTAETSYDKPDLDGLIDHICGTVKERMQSEAKQALEARRRDG